MVYVIVSQLNMLYFSDPKCLSSDSLVSTAATLLREKALKSGNNLNAASCRDVILL